MRQTLLESPKVIKCIETPLPQVQPGWILAKTMRTGICGTDVHSYFGETIFGKVFPFHIGHEICAIVQSAGEGCVNLKEGDVIVVNPFFTCGACEACYRGQENDCRNKTTIGLKGFGGFSEYVYVPAASAYRVNSDDYAAMSLVEPLATVIYGFDKLRVDPTKTVLINGAGTIGLLFLHLFKSADVAQVTLTDLNRAKLDNALDMGADEAFCITDEAEAARFAARKAQGFDIVVDCTGAIQSMQSCVDAIAFGGQILLFGLCSPDKSMVIEPFALYKKDAAIFTSFALTKQSFCKAVALLENKKIDVGGLIDAVVPLAELENSINLIAQGKANGKIIIDTTR